MKLKSFYMTKEMYCKLKRLPREWEKIFSSCTSDKRLITRICRELKRLNSKKFNDPMKKRTKELNRPFSKEEVQWLKNIQRNAHHS
jgi:hypothetical protein